MGTLFRKKPSRIRAGVALLIGMALIAGAGVANAADRPARGLFVSANADRTKATELKSGASLSGSKYVFVKGYGQASSINFFLDDTKTPIKVERFKPYDFAGTAANGSATAFDFSSLAPGKHLIAYLVMLNGHRMGGGWATFQSGPIASTPTTTGSTTPSSTTTPKPTTTTTTVKPVTTTTTVVAPTTTVPPIVTTTTVPKVTTTTAKPVQPPTTTNDPQTWKIMPLGDSITAWPPSYRPYLYDLLVAEGDKIDFVGSVKGAAAIDPDNEGHPGWRNDELAAQAKGWVSTYQPNVVLLHAGTNDLLQGATSQVAIDRLRDLLNQIYAGKSDPHVVVAGIIPIYGAASAENAKYVAATPALVAEFKAKGFNISFVDLSHSVSQADLGDGVHPNAAGAQKMAAAWLPAVSAVIHRK